MVKKDLSEEGTLKQKYKLSDSQLHGGRQAM